MAAITIRTSAKTPAGIARAYVREHGSHYRYGSSQVEPTRDHDATLEPDGTWTIWGCTGCPAEPRGAVRLATGVHVEEE